MGDGRQESSSETVLAAGELVNSKRRIERRNIFACIGVIHVQAIIEDP